jgi:hypothetical protein
MVQTVKAPHCLSSFQLFWSLRTQYSLFLTARADFIGIIDPIIVGALFLLPDNLLDLILVSKSQGRLTSLGRGNALLLRRAFQTLVHDCAFAGQGHPPSSCMCSHAELLPYRFNDADIQKAIIDAGCVLALS